MKFLWVMILVPTLAMADGGVVRVRETQGVFTITIFSPPIISRDVPADVTVMVQQAGDVVMDAEVNLSFIPPAGVEMSADNMRCGSHSHQLTSIPATHAQAANKLLYGTSAALPAAGDWQLRASIQQGGKEARAACVLPVGTPARRLVRLWPYLGLPPFVIGMFALNQWLSRQSGSGHSYFDAKT